MESVRNGERKGQDELLRRYAAQVFALISKLVSDKMDAQELAQDTFIKAFQKIDRFNASQSTLSTWLCSIAYRLTLDFLKCHRPFVVSLEDVAVWETDISDEELEAALSTGNEKRIEMLQELVKEMSEEDRMLLTLYYFDNRPLTEIAYITGVNAKALANRLYRIRKKLQKRLEAI